MQEYRIKYPSMPLYLRGDSGFASPYLYDACEENNCKYAISLKQNSTLIKYAADADDALYRATRENQIDYAVKYGEFEHQAGSWTHPREASSRLRSPNGKEKTLIKYDVDWIWCKKYMESIIPQIEKGR